MVAVRTLGSKVNFKYHLLWLFRVVGGRCFSLMNGEKSQSYQGAKGFVGLYRLWGFVGCYKVFRV